MAVQWEMCVVSVRSDAISIFTSLTSKQVFKLKEYIQNVSKIINVKKADDDDVLPYILADGWEPFTVIDNNYFYFRRRIDS